MINQLPRTGTPEQILRAVSALALSSALGLEIAVLGQEMGSSTWAPIGMVDANGNPISFSMNDTSFGAPTGWLPTGFAKVLTTEQLRPVGPYPLLQLNMSPGRIATDGAGHQMIIDQGGIVGYEHTLEAVSVATSGNPTISSRSAWTLSEALKRLIERNPSLGGLVCLIDPDGDAEAAGPVENAKTGNLTGVRQQYTVRTLQVNAP